MRLTCGHFALVISLVAEVTFAAPLPQSPSCKVTIHTTSSFGTDKLSTVLWPEGTITFRPGGPGFIASDGALGMKIGWNRGLPEGSG